MNIGDYVQTLQVPKEFPLVAWRGWGIPRLWDAEVRKYVRNPYSLSSVSYDNHRWGIRKSANVTPAQGNHNGLWCFKVWDDGYKNGCAFSSYKGDVQGRILIWGQVVETEYGYRAQHAKIDGLIVHHKWDVADWYAHMLGVKRLKLSPVVAKWEVVDR